MKIQELLRRTVEMGSSDLHLKAGRPPTVRVDGTLEALPEPALSAADAEAIADELMPDWCREAFSTPR